MWKASFNPLTLSVFQIGYRKANGELREMTAQRHVQRPYQGGDVGGGVPEGLLVVYDLQIASRIARKELEEVDVNDYDPSILKQAYRRIYPKNVEYIKGGGREYRVIGDFDDFDEE
jgi:hypothetical protein